MNQTVYEKGIEKGRREKRLEWVIWLLENRFGSLSLTARQHLDNLPMSELQQLAAKIGAAASLAKLGLPE